MKKLLFIFAILILVNCYNSRYIKQHPELNKYQKLNESQKRQYLEIEKGYNKSDIENIINSLVAINMTGEQVRLSWGIPDNIQDVDSLNQWVYVRRIPYIKERLCIDKEYGCIFINPDFQYKTKKQYLYFENGILTSWVN